MEPEHAGIQTALYSEGCSFEMTYLRAVDLPEPTSPVRVATAPQPHRIEEALFDCFDILGFQDVPEADVRGERLTGHAEETIDT